MSLASHKLHTGQQVGKANKMDITKVEREPKSFNFFIERPGSRPLAPTKKVPLIAVDQLPPWLQLDGVPKELDYRDIVDLQRVAAVHRTPRVYDVRIYQHGKWVLIPSGMKSVMSQQDDGLVEKTRDVSLRHRDGATRTSIAQSRPRSPSSSASSSESPPELGSESNIPVSKKTKDSRRDGTTTAISTTSSEGPSKATITQGPTVRSSPSSKTDDEDRDSFVMNPHGHHKSKHAHKSSSVGAVTPSHPAPKDTISEQERCQPHLGLQRDSYLYRSIIHQPSPKAPVVTYSNQHQNSQHRSHDFSASSPSETTPARTTSKRSIAATPPPHARASLPNGNGDCTTTAAVVNNTAPPPPPPPPRFPPIASISSKELRRELRKRDQAVAPGQIKSSRNRTRGRGGSNKYNNPYKSSPLYRNPLNNNNNIDNRTTGLGNNDETQSVDGRREQVCRRWASHGSCHYGFRCQYRHPISDDEHDDDDHGYVHATSSTSNQSARGSSPPTPLYTSSNASDTSVTLAPGFSSPMGKSGRRRRAVLEAHVMKKKKKRDDDEEWKYDDVDGEVKKHHHHEPLCVPDLIDLGGL